MTPRLRLTTVAAATLAAAMLLGPPASTQGRPRAGLSFANGEVIVRFARALDEPEWRFLEREADADRRHPTGGRGARLIRSRSLDTDALLTLLRQRPDVLYAEPNYIVRLSGPPDDPDFPSLWGLLNVGQAVNGSAAGHPGADIGAVAAWDVSTGSRSNVVAVIDTGIDYLHPDLAPNVWAAPAAFTVVIGGSTIECAAGTHGFNAITGVCDPMDDHDHGTHVAGTIGAAGGNGAGVTGVNWTASLIGAKFIGPDGTGTIADAIDAIEFLIQAKEVLGAAANIRVLSNSWGGSEFSQALQDRIARARDHDMLFVAAAGNNGLPNDWFPMYPASYALPNVIAVAATDANDSRAAFSNYGASSVHLGAPGVDIFSTVRQNQYRFMSGTSMATPHVSGAAALVLAACSLDTDDVRTVLLDSVNPVPGLANVTTTGGRLNVDKAVRSCTSLPGRATDLSAAGGNARVSLTWTAAPGATTYNVKRSAGPGGPYVTVAGAVRTTAYTDTTVVNDTPYYYVVSGANMLGQGEPSNEASATPRVPPDFVVPSFETPSKGGAGLPLTASMTTSNTASAAALDPTVTRIYFSADYQIDAGDVVLDGTQAVPPLAPGAAHTSSVTATIPAGTAPGVYFLIAKADGDGRVLELSETNNTRSALLTVGPDVLLSTLTAPSTAVPGTAFTVSDTVKNQGGGSAGVTVLRFYLSANASFDAGDQPLAGSRAIPSLAPGATSSGATTLTLPVGTPTGSHYILGKADADSGVVETSEANNVAARVVQVGPDLILSALVGPSTAAPGGSFAVTDTVKNQGSADAGASSTRFYFSDDLSIDEGDTPLTAARPVPALTAGATSAGTVQVTIPGGLAAGTYYVIGTADGSQQVAETQEANNTRSFSVRIGPDLTAASLMAPAAAAAGAAITVSETIRNTGAGPAGASSTWYYLSANAVFDASDVRLGGSRAVPPLAEGASDGGSGTVTIPEETMVGSYYLFARADGADAVAETSETNNTAVRSIRIGPDLTVAFGTMPSSRAAGTTLTIVETVTNQGAALAGASTTRYYLSRDVFLGPDDVPLDVERQVPALAAGASSAGQTTVLIPADTAPAQYYLIAEADGLQVVIEALETNNKAVKGLTVVP